MYDEPAPGKVTRRACVTFRRSRPVLDCMTTHRTVVVTGATGNVGRPLVTELTEAGVEVRAVTRQPDAADFPPGVTAFDSAVDALPGADAVFLNSRALGERTDGDRRRGREAQASRGWSRCRRSTPTTTSPDSRRVSAATATERSNNSPSTPAWNGSACAPACSRRTSPGCGRRRSVRATWSAARTRRRRPHRSPTADIAAVAARALLTDDLVGQRIPLTGPQALTNAQLVEADRRRPRPRTAYTSRRQKTWCDNASSAIGFPRRVRRRLHATAGRDGRPPRARHPRRREDPRPPGSARSRSGWPNTATCSPISKGDEPCPRRTHVHRVGSSR